MSEKIQIAFIAARELEKILTHAESLINEIFSAAPELDDAQAGDLYNRVIQTRKRLIVLGYSIRGVELQLSNLLKEMNRGYEES